MRSGETGSKAATLMNDAYLQQLLNRLDLEAAERGRPVSQQDPTGDAAPADRASAAATPVSAGGPAANGAGSPISAAASDPAQILKDKIAALAAKASQAAPASSTATHAINPTIWAGPPKQPAATPAATAAAAVRTRPAAAAPVPAPEPLFVPPRA